MYYNTETYFNNMSIAKTKQYKTNEAKKKINNKILLLNTNNNLT